MGFRREKLRRRLIEALKEVMKECGGYTSFWIAYTRTLEKAGVDLTFKQFAQLIRGADFIEKEQKGGRRYYKLKNQTSRGDDDGSS